MNPTPLPALVFQKESRRRDASDDVLAEYADELEASAEAANQPETEFGDWDAGDDSAPIEPRGWLLGNSFCRRYLSSLQAGGGIGKTALRIAQALSLATGRELTGEHVFQRCRVLLVSLEDDRDELRRRVKAAMLHHGIGRDEVRGWLFLAAPGAKGWKLASLKDGAVEAGELEAKLVEVIRRRAVDVAILDPFVKTHGVEENANSQIDVVANILARIAIENDCAIDAPHHVAKGAADPGNADRGRGASAFKDAARLVYTLAPMSLEESETFGISEEERRRLVRLDSGKVNLAPAAAKATWFRLVSVNLGNGAGIYPEGDNVQAVEPWEPPDMWEGLSHVLLNEILSAIDKGLPDGNRYSDHGAAKERAAWRVVAEHAPEKTEKQARQVIKAWVKTGLLEMQDYRDPVRSEPARGLKVNHAKRPS
jgi:AAA domain